MEEYAFNDWGPWSISSASPVHEESTKVDRACPVKAESTFVEYINMAMTQIRYLGYESVMYTGTVPSSVDYTHLESVAWPKDWFPTSARMTEFHSGKNEVIGLYLKHREERLKLQLPGTQCLLCSSALFPIVKMMFF